MASAPLDDAFASDAYPAIVAAAYAMGLGPADWVRLETVALRLRAEGIAGDNPRVPGWFAAALCRSVAERRAFLEACGVPTDSGVTNAIRTPKQATIEDEGAARNFLKTHGRRLALAVSGLVLTATLLVLAALFLPPPPDDPVVNQLPQPDPTQIWVQKERLVPHLGPTTVWDWLTLALLAGLVLALIGYWVWRRRWLSELKRNFTPDPDKAVPLALQRDDTRLFGSQAVRFGLRRLRRHRSQSGGRLDVRASIAATVRAGGQPQPRFRGRWLVPEYLLLAEREAPRDHLAMAGQALAQRIAQENVAIGHYEFLARPDRLRATWGERASVPLASILARHADARTMLLAEGYDLRDSSLTPAWVERITDAGPAVHLNPNLTGRSEGEALLAEDGIDSFPLSADGISAMAQRLADPRGRHAAAAGTTHGDLARSLDGERKLLLAEEAPRPAIIDGVVDDLAAWLDPQAYRWFAALALFPYLEPALTLYLGSHLEDEDGQPVLTDARFLTLARLPWMRAGMMPRWLRLALAHTLDPATLASATAAIQAFLLPVLGADAGEISIDAGRDPAKRRMLLAWLATSPDSEFHDPILIDTVKGRPPTRLGVRPAEATARRLRAWRDNPQFWALAVMLVAGGLVLLFRSPTDTADRYTGDMDKQSYNVLADAPVENVTSTIDNTTTSENPSVPENVVDTSGEAKGHTTPTPRATATAGTGEYSEQGLKARQDRLFADLAPEFQGVAAKLMDAARAQGIQLYVTGAYITPEQSAKTMPGGKRMWATAHTLGLAFDVVPVINGKPEYGAEGTAQLQIVAKIAGSMGLVWGGDFTGQGEQWHFESGVARDRVRASRDQAEPQAQAK